MSQRNEHTSDETESEMHAKNHNKEQSKCETSMLNNETEQPMLEDEEMPTYISVSTPSKREDSDISNTKQVDRIPIEEDHSRSPYPSDDQGGGSIYVLSSGEESTHPYNDEESNHPITTMKRKMNMQIVKIWMKWILKMIVKMQCIKIYFPKNLRYLAKSAFAKTSI